MFQRTTHALKLVCGRDDDRSSYSPANATGSYTTDPGTATAAKLVLRRTFRGASGSDFGGVGGQSSMRWGGVSVPNATKMTKTTNYRHADVKRLDRISPRNRHRRGDEEKGGEYILILLLCLLLHGDLLVNAIKSLHARVSMVSSCSSLSSSPSKLRRP